MKRSMLLMTYLTLVGLLAATVGVAFLPLPGAIKSIAGLAIAVTKAVIIAGVFMNLRRQRGLTMIFAAAGLLWLLLFFGLTWSDYLTRGL
jgi:cytochrome c oxidase subunit 4